MRECSRRRFKLRTPPGERLRRVGLPKNFCAPGIFGSGPRWWESFGGRRLTGAVERACVGIIVLILYRLLYGDFWEYFLISLFL